MLDLRERIERPSSTITEAKTGDSAYVYSPNDEVKLGLITNFFLD